MGCDIHPVIQRRHDSDSPWEFVEYANKKYIEAHKKNDPQSWNILHNDHVWSGIKERNYVYFTLLAGVRQRHNVTPIANPRGVPADFDYEYNFYSEDSEIQPRKHLPRILAKYGPYGDTFVDGEDESSKYTDLGDHSFSHVYLRELIEYPYWEAEITEETVYVLLQHYPLYLRKVKRRMSLASLYVSHLAAKNYLIIPESSAASPDIQIQMEATFNDRVIVEIEHKIKLRELCSDFYYHSIPWLKTLASSPDDVRLVFGFDS